MSHVSLKTQCLKIVPKCSFENYAYKSIFLCNGVLALKRSFYGLFFTGFQTVWCQLFSHVYHKKLPIYWNRSKSALNICKLCARLFTISFSWQFPPSIGHVKKNMYVGTFKKVIRQMTQSLKTCSLSNYIIHISYSKQALSKCSWAYIDILLRAALVHKKPRIEFSTSKQGKHYQNSQAFA